MICFYPLPLTSVNGYLKNDDRALARRLMDKANNLF